MVFEAGDVAEQVGLVLEALRPGEDLIGVGVEVKHRRNCESLSSSSGVWTD